MKRKEKQASGELPPPSAEELEKERKLQEAQLAMARERAHAHALKEYRDEFERELEARKKLADEELATKPHMVELAQMRKSAVRSTTRSRASRRVGRRSTPCSGRRGPSGRLARTPRRSAGLTGPVDPFRVVCRGTGTRAKYLAREGKAPTAGGSDRGTGRTGVRCCAAAYTFLRNVREAPSATAREDDVVDVRPPFRPISRDASLAVEVPFFLQ